MKFRSKRTRALVALLGGIGMALSAGPVQADYGLIGKSAAYVSQSGIPVPTSSAVLSQVTLPKGKKKRVLEVRAQVVETTNTATALGVSAVVNGIPLEAVGPAAQAIEGCGVSAANCTAHGLWWIDLDQAELANPGLFINQQLNVVLYGYAKSTAATATVSLRAKMVKP